MGRVSQKTTIHEPDQLAAEEPPARNSTASNASNSKEAKELAKRWDEEDRIEKRRERSSDEKANTPGVTRVTNTKERQSFPGRKFGPTAAAATAAVPGVTRERQPFPTSKFGRASNTNSNPEETTTDDGVPNSPEEGDQALDEATNDGSTAADHAPAVPPPPPAVENVQVGDEENQIDNPRESLLVEASLVAIGYDDDESTGNPKDTTTVATDIAKAEVVEAHTVSRWGLCSAGDRWLVFGIAVLVASVAAIGILCGSGVCTPRDNEPEVSSSSSSNEGNLFDGQDSFPPLSAFPTPFVPAQVTVNPTQSPVEQPQDEDEDEVAAANQPNEEEPTSLAAPSSVPIAPPSTTAPSSGLTTNAPSPAPTTLLPSTEFPALMVSIQGLTQEPTLSPTFIPTMIPSRNPSANPSSVPTKTPSQRPTFAPTSIFPFGSPTNGPLTPSPMTPMPIQSTGSPTGIPSLGPTDTPSLGPTGAPSLTPTATPSLTPTGIPSFIPSLLTPDPTAFPTSNLPSSSPSRSPSLQTLSPTTAMPLSSPVAEPSYSPSFSPTGTSTVEATMVTNVNVATTTTRPSTAGMAYFIFDYGFQPGLDRGPTNDEMDALLCNTNEYILSKVSEFLVAAGDNKPLQMRSWYINWIYDTTQDSPLRVTFHADIRYINEIDTAFVDKQVVFEAFDLTSDDIATYITQYVWQVDGNNMFRYANQVAYWIRTVEPEPESYLLERTVCGETS